MKRVSMTQALTKSVLNTAPAIAVPLSDVKTFLRVDGSSEDAEITAMINAATQKLEDLTDRKFASQKWDIYLDAFPCDNNKEMWWDGSRDGAMNMLHGPSEKINLPFGPLISVEGFKTYDDNGTEYSFDSSNYNIDTIGPFGAVVLKVGSVWPSTVLRTVNGIKILATFGYASVPADIQEAIKLTVGKMFENRGDKADGEFVSGMGFTVPPMAAALLMRYMRVKI